VLAIAFVFVMTGLAIAAIWLRTGLAVQHRVYESLVLGAVAAIVILGCTRLTFSIDTSENRMNSFPESDEEALRQIREPLRIEAHLAPEDPRRADLERQAISKLRRIMPNLRVDYVSATSIGLFEQTSAHYGEIWYELNGRKEMSRVTTAEGVLESIYSMAGMTPPRENETGIFRGHPLAALPRGAAFIFYGLWPTVVLAVATFLKRSLT
jgi:hypothetical protein